MILKSSFKKCSGYVNTNVYNEYTYQHLYLIWFIWHRNSRQ